MPRHQTLRATLDWSYELLSERERIVLARLAVFAGGFTLSAAAAVAADETAPTVAVLGHMAELIEKSLVAATVSEREPRLRLLETNSVLCTRETLGKRRAGRDQTASRHLLSRPVGSGDQRAGGRSFGGSVPGRDRQYPCSARLVVFPAGDAAIGVALAAASAPTWVELGLLAECRDWMAAALDVLPPERLGSRQEMALQLALGYSRMLTEGLTDDTHAALIRADELGQAFDDRDYQLRARTGLVIFGRMSADLAPALALSREVDAIAQQIASPLALATADCLLTSSLLWVGEYAEARTRAEAASRRNAPELRRAHLLRHGYDYWMNSRTLLAQILWVQGFSEQSLRLTRDVLIEAEQTSHPFTLPYAFTSVGCLVPLWLGDLQMAEQSIDRLKAHAGSPWPAQLLRRRSGLRGTAVCGSRRCGCRPSNCSSVLLPSCAKPSFTCFTRCFSASWRTSWRREARLDQALVAADEAVGRAKRNNNFWWLPEALRIKGEVLLLASQGDSAEAEDHFRQSLDLAHRQGALAWELRAATSIARLMRDRGRGPDAGALLQPVCDRFTEGFRHGRLESRKGAARVGAMIARFTRANIRWSRFLEELTEHLPRSVLGT